MFSYILTFTLLIYDMEIYTPKLVDGCLVSRIIVLHVVCRNDVLRGCNCACS